MKTAITVLVFAIAFLLIASLPPARPVGISAEDATFAH